MKKNMGIADRIIRTTIAIVLGSLIVTRNISGAWSIVSGVFAVMLLLTSATGWCPGYKPFGVSTKRTK
jgi:hypothetical protein